MRLVATSGLVDSFSRTTEGRSFFPTVKYVGTGTNRVSHLPLRLNCKTLTGNTLQLATIAALLEEISHNYTGVERSMFGVDRRDFLDEKA